jgi:hypothetical protein
LSNVVRAYSVASWPPRVLLSQESIPRMDAAAAGDFERVAVDQ